MGKLTSDQIKFIAQNYQNIDKVYRSQIKFCFNSKNKGETAFNMLQEAYKSEIENYHYGTDKRDFRFEYTSKDVRDQVYDDILNAIAVYHNSYGYETNDYGDVFSGSEIDIVSGTDTDIKKTTDWTTYIIIGAAAVVIVLLLWDKKRK